MKDGIELTFLKGSKDLGRRQVDKEEESRRDIAEDTLSPNVARMVRIMKNGDGGIGKEVVEAKKVRKGITDIEGPRSMDNWKREEGRSKMEIEDIVRRAKLHNRTVWDVDLDTGDKMEQK